jgi:hypothetical protein
MREQLVETATLIALKAAKRVKQEEAFYSRIDRDQALEVNRCHPHALVIWLELRRKRAMRWGEPLVIGDGDLADMGILPRTRDRALAALETAGFARIERRRGCLPRIWLRE